MKTTNTTICLAAALFAAMFTNVTLAQFKPTQSLPKKRLSNWLESRFKNDDVRSYNARHERQARRKILQRYPTSDFYVGFSRTIHAREGAGYTIRIWSMALGSDNLGSPGGVVGEVAVKVRQDLRRVQMEAKHRGVDIFRQRPIVVRQLWVKHREGVGPVIANTPRSWVFYAVWKLPRRAGRRWLDARSDGVSAALVDGVSHGAIWKVEQSDGFVRLRSLNNRYTGTGVQKRWLDAKSDGSSVGLASAWSHGTRWRIEQGNGFVRLRSLNNNYTGTGAQKHWLDARSDGNSVGLANATSHGTRWRIESEGDHIILRSLNRNY